MALILASASPRRRELLTQAGLSFTVCVPDCDEQCPDGIAPDAMVAMLSARKAQAAAVLCAACDTVLAADTVVALNGRILGKPADEEDARAMLRFLSGKTHSVFTGVTVSRGARCEQFVCETKVSFYPLTPEDIDAYIATGEPADKAGAYGIQGRGALLVREIAGDYCNVVGLPLAQTVRLLRSFSDI